MTSEESSRAEAITLARAAIADANYYLNNARARFTDALGEASYDTWWGGIVSGQRKFAKMDKAELSLRNAQRALGDVRSRLQPLDLTVDGDLELGRVHRNVDIWLDNPISDLRTKAKVKAALRSVEDVSTALVRLDSALGRELRRLGEPA